MKSYCMIGWSLIAVHVAAAALLVPAGWTATEGALIAAAYLGLIWALPSLVAGTVQHALMHGAKRGLRQTKKRR